MSASKLETGQRSHGYSSYLLNASAAPPNTLDNGHLYAPPPDYHHHCSFGGEVPVSAFGRGSTVDSHVVTTEEKRATKKLSEPGTDAQYTCREQNFGFVSVRHNKPQETDTKHITIPVEEERTQNQSQIVEPSQSSEPNDHQSNKDTSLLAAFSDGVNRETKNLPSVANSAFHDSITRGTSGEDLQPRLEGTVTKSIETTITEAPSSNSTLAGRRTVIDQASFGGNMGYSSSGAISWQVPHLDFSKSKTMNSAPQHLSNGHSLLNDEDSTTVRSSDSVSLGSPAHGPLLGPSAIEQNPGTGGAAAVPQSTATTPSTVSTAPSTNDEGSMGALDHHALERLALRGEPLGQSHWEPHYRDPYQTQLYVPDETDHGTFGTASVLPPSQRPVANPNAWVNPPRHVTQQRVASFRNDAGLANTVQHEQNRWHQPLRYDPHTQSVGPSPVRSNKGQVYGGNVPYGTYHAGTHRAMATTPPRMGRTARPAPTPSPHRVAPGPGATSHSSQLQAGGSVSSNPRSPSEVLKTLLRKKACLYEPDTSRAVALVTWLVGRELALEFGYFSRQQLQAGVHACVAGKIFSAVITRTKVNRCMQIILNSCFHYIIPRPDGTEENGDSFRLAFAKEVADDTGLLRELPPPWNDLSVRHDVVMEASTGDLEGKQSKGSSSAPSSPQNSPRVESIPTEKTSPRSKEEAESDSKRAVLLCFNENVRCAEDVFRCHNEFIRDTAHASGLQLSSSEWRSFFGREAANAQQLWGNIGIPVPRTPNFTQPDVLGMMTKSELAKFRTTWCSKRYDHDHELCGFAHVEVNGGWLRRNFLEYEYRMEMCPDIVHIPAGHRPEDGSFVVNECPRGVSCSFAHSKEEILYHPRGYKHNLCSSLTRLGGCQNGDVCPDFHPVDSYKFPTKKGEGRLNARQPRQGGAGAASKTAPSLPPLGAPILYCSPAPVSRFEEQLQLPGLKNLYRRNCSVLKAHLRNYACSYSFFGDDDGTAIDPSKRSAKSLKKPGLPQPRKV